MILYNTIVGLAAGVGLLLVASRPAYEHFRFILEITTNERLNP
jgi:hypothetical protein